jgi:chromosome segregation ATPase
VLARVVAAESSGEQPTAPRTRSFQPVKAALVRCSDDLERRAVRRQPDTQVPNPIASSYERLIGALGVIEQRREVRQREARAREELADKSAREEKTRRDISDSVSMLGRLRSPNDPETPSRQAIPTPAQSKAAHERAELNQRIEELEHELTVVEQARQAAQTQVHQLRSERGDLDKLIALRRQLEAQLREQLRHVAEEQRRREEAEASRKQAEQREGTIQQQLETQFLRAEHEELEREKAERTLRDVVSRLDQSERDWDIQSYAVRRELELRLEAEKSKEAVQAQVAELETQVSGLQAARKTLRYATYACGLVTFAAIPVIVIVLI